MCGREFINLELLQRRPFLMLSPAILLLINILSSASLIVAFTVSTFGLALSTSHSCISTDFNFGEEEIV